MLLASVALVPAVFGQAPGVLWTNNLGARLFAVDGQTNVYVNTNGTVIILNGSGVALQTNTICPVVPSGPVIAQRDSAGNYYFAGLFDGAQNFGGITLVGGWTNYGTPPHWVPGSPTCFLAKYASNGVLQWVNSFGDQGAMQNILTDMVVNDDGSTIATYGDSYSSGKVARFTTGGTMLWNNVLSSGGGSFIRISKLSGTNGCYFNCRGSYSPFIMYSGYYSDAGGFTYLSLPPGVSPWVQSYTSANGKPVAGTATNVLVAGLETSTKALLMSCGSLTWTQSIGTVEQWILADDSQHNLFLAGAGGGFSKYTSSGVFVWSTNLGSPGVSMIIDERNNRFVSLANGSIARLGSEPLPVLAQISNGPLSQTVFNGDSASLTASVSGTAPLGYRWQQNGTNYPNGTNLTLTLNPVKPAHAGTYTLVVTNAAGAVTSAPAMLRVKSVQLYAGGQMLTNGNYTFVMPPTFTIRSAFTNGLAFYTLDGSAPSFASRAYSTPFVLTSNATVRALGYSADFLQSDEADLVVATVLPQHTLTATTAGGGSVTRNPSAGTYAVTNIVAVTAVPAAGWTFLYWTGDASGADPTVHISMEQNRAVQAVFGTSLSTTVAGDGQVLMSPSSSLHPYGSVVTLTAVPQAGSYFGLWGNAASGNSNPLYFTVTNANRTVSSIFGATPAGQATLVALAEGGGQVGVNPRANLYAINTSITLTATPYSGQSFIGWSGDASGTQNPLTVSLTQSKVITAVFTRWPVLAADSQSLTPGGFRINLTSGPGLAYRVYASSNLFSWQSLGTVTNLTGETNFTDATATNFPLRFYKALPWP